MATVEGKQLRRNLQACHSAIPSVHYVERDDKFTNNYSDPTFIPVITSQQARIRVVQVNEIRPRQITLPSGSYQASPRSMNGHKRLPLSVILKCFSFIQSKL